VIVDRLQPDPRRPGSIRVVTGGQPAWTVPADVARELQLAPGVAITAALLERLDQAADEEAALRAGLRHLERRGHAARELARKLARKGHSDVAIEAALDRLLTLGLLDDAAFARQYATARAGRGRSPARIRRDLQALGVDRTISAEAVAEMVADETVPDPIERTLAQAERRAAAMASLPRVTRQRRLLAFFARRGWGGAEAMEHVTRLLEGEHTPR
jgi:regulatory protein